MCSNFGQIGTDEKEVIKLWRTRAERMNKILKGLGIEQEIPETMTFEDGILTLVAAIVAKITPKSAAKNIKDLVNEALEEALEEILAEVKNENKTEND